jgi:hypothetical protein
VRVRVPDRAVKEPRAHPVDHQGQGGHGDHHTGSWRPALAQRLDALRDDEGGRDEHQDGAEDCGHGLRAPQAVREARCRPPDGEAHREEAHAEGQDIREKVNGVGLQDDAVGRDRAPEFDEEKPADDEKDGAKARGLVCLGRGEGGGRVLVLVRLPVLVAVLVAVLVLVRFRA